MSKSVFDEVIGRELNSIMGSYFVASGETVGKPDSIVMLRKSGDLCELCADGKGRIKEWGNPMERLFFVENIGYSMIAPIILALAGAFDGTEVVEGVYVSEGEYWTKVQLLFSGNKSMSILFEDDEISFLY